MRYDDLWAAGSVGPTNRYREQMLKVNDPIVVGDIVAPFRFYRNGRPVPKHKFDYLSEPKKIGVVISEFMNERYGDITIVVKWNDEPARVTNYIKGQAPQYLVKLS
jgi:hypothetical protein